MSRPIHDEDSLLEIVRALADDDDCGCVVDGKGCSEAFPDARPDMWCPYCRAVAWLTENDPAWVASWEAAHAEGTEP